MAGPRRRARPPLGLPGQREVVLSTGWVSRQQTRDGSFPRPHPGSGVPTQLAQRCLWLCLRGGPSKGPQTESWSPLPRGGRRASCQAPAQDTKAQEEPSGLSSGHRLLPRSDPCAPGAWTLGAQVQVRRTGSPVSSLRADWGALGLQDPVSHCTTHVHMLPKERTHGLPAKHLRTPRVRRLRRAGPTPPHNAGKGQGARDPNGPGGPSTHGLGASGRPAGSRSPCGPRAE